MNSKITFISNNAKEIQNSVKIINLFGYLKSDLTESRLIFLRETHSCINDEIRWRDGFNGDLFLFHQENKLMRSCNKLLRI